MKRYIRASYEDEVNQATAELNARLPQLKTWDDLQAFRDDMYSYGYGLQFKMKTKTGGYENGIFKKDDTTVEYITDRTSTVYKCQIKNLYRVMEVTY